MQLDSLFATIKDINLPCISTEQTIHTIKHMYFKIFTNSIGNLFKKKSNSTMMKLMRSMKMEMIRKLDKTIVNMRNNIKSMRKCKF